MKNHAKQSAQAAFRTKVLLDTNQSLQQAKSRDDIMAVTASQLIKLLGRDIIAYFAENGTLSAPALFPASEKRRQMNGFPKMNRQLRRGS